MITATAKVMGREYKASGETKADALRNLPIKNIHARGATLLTLSDGTKTMQKFISAHQAQNLFHPNPQIREIHVKQIGARFDV